MKKAAIITTIIGGILTFVSALPFLCAVLLTKRSPSVGIIGGADGPTAILITSSLFDSLICWVGIIGLLTLSVGIILLIISTCKKNNDQ